MLGEVQGAIAGLKTSVDHMVDSFGSLNAKLDDHTQNDAESFAGIREHIGEGLGGLRDRIAQLEMLPDLVDSHGDAIVSIERRLSEADAMRRALEAARETNRRWQLGLVSASGAVAGAISSAHGAAVLKWLASAVVH